MHASLAGARWPEPADVEAADRAVERFPDRLPASAAALLRSLGGNSPYLTDLALRDPEVLGAIWTHGPDVVADGALGMVSGLAPGMPRAKLAEALRRQKRVLALAVAVADTGGVWTLERVTAALSDFAEAALRACVGHLLLAAHAAGELVLPDPTQPARECGFTVLGMGKLGARELNYSSDVDLILLRDPDAGVYHGENAGDFYTRLSRGLVALMEQRDADGYVFRTDLRLRPDPGATPPCVALPAAIAYYESLGQNWERAAMLKARPVAGDIPLGLGFLEAIRPFVWRRHLDFAALADIRAMKRRMDARTGAAAAGDAVARLAGRNVKLGPGGIREIEFLAQTLQLVWGGRQPELRLPRTLEALTALVKAGHLPRRRATALAAAYRFLRAVEHRLQMVADRQTHDLPSTREGLDRFARFMSMADGQALAETLLRHAEPVQAAWGDLFEKLPETSEGPVRELDFAGQGAATAAGTRQALAAMGFRDAEAIVEAVRGWQTGRLRALRSLRARDLMDSVLPGLLRRLAEQPQPDVAFARFDAFLGRLPAGVQLLTLFQRHPALLARICAILGAAPSLAEHLARSPAALEGLLMAEQAPDVPRILKARLADARALEEAIAIIRTVAREEDFAISVATIEGRLTAEDAGWRRADLADAVICALLPRVLDDFATRFGRVRGGGMAVVLLGKAGSREMMAGSDLDLMLVYDHPARATESVGAKVLPASQWFIRAVHAFVGALTAPDAAGPLYAVDMRLRPSGNKGPVAVSLASFRAYHGKDGGAWTWERMALTRARVIGGGAALRRRIEAAIADAVTHAGPPATVLRDAAEMRARMERDGAAAGPWDVKLRPGGQVDVEFVAQALRLAHPGAFGTVADTTTRAALARLGEAGVLDGDATELLLRADGLWRSVQGILRILVGRAPVVELPVSSVPVLLAACDAVDLAALRTTMDEMSQRVRAVFATVLEGGAE